ncbi:MAG: hypothetical protein QXO15_09795 [Nitrososphaerota archaeon]
MFYDDLFGDSLIDELLAQAYEEELLKEALAEEALNAALEEELWKDALLNSFYSPVMPYYYSYPVWYPSFEKTAGRKKRARSRADRRATQVLESLKQAMDKKPHLKKLLQIVTSE